MDRSHHLPPRLRISKPTNVDLIPRRCARLVHKPRDGKPDIQAKKVMLKKWGTEASSVPDRPTGAAARFADHRCRPPSVKLCTSCSLIVPGATGERMCHSNCAPCTSPYHLVSMVHIYLYGTCAALTAARGRSIVKELILREGASVVCLQETTASLL